MWASQREDSSMVNANWERGKHYQEVSITKKLQEWEKEEPLLYVRIVLITDIVEFFCIFLFLFEVQSETG